LVKSRDNGGTEEQEFAVKKEGVGGRFQVGRIIAKRMARLKKKGRISREGPEKENPSERREATKYQKKEAQFHGTGELKK